MDSEYAAASRTAGKPILSATGNLFTGFNAMWITLKSEFAGRVFGRRSRRSSLRSYHRLARGHGR